MLYRGLDRDDLRPKAHGQRHRKIDKVALNKHVQDHPEMYLHERATLFDVHTRAISRTLKTLGIVKKRASV
jgi:putative transposase